MCTETELLSWPTLKERGNRLYLLKGGVSKNLKTYFKTPAGIKRNLVSFFVVVYLFIYFVVIYLFILRERERERE